MKEAFHSPAGTIQYKAISHHLLLNGIPDLQFLMKM